MYLLMRNFLTAGARLAITMANSKRGLVARHCNHTRLFGRARRWMYNHGPSLVAFGHVDWLTNGAGSELSELGRLYNSFGK